MALRVPILVDLLRRLIEVFARQPANCLTSENTPRADLHASKYEVAPERSHVHAWLILAPGWREIRDDYVGGDDLRSRENDEVRGHVRHQFKDASRQWITNFSETRRTAKITIMNVENPPWNQAPLAVTNDAYDCSAGVSPDATFPTV